MSESHLNRGASTLLRYGSSLLNNGPQHYYGPGCRCLWDGLANTGRSMVGAGS
jgi:hypothetical protein